MKSLRNRKLSKANQNPSRFCLGCVRDRQPQSYRHRNGSRRSSRPIRIGFLEGFVAMPAGRGGRRIRPGKSGVSFPNPTKSGLCFIFVRESAVFASPLHEKERVLLRRAASYSSACPVVIRGTSDSRDTNTGLCTRRSDLCFREGASFTSSDSWSCSIPRTSIFGT